MLLQKRAKAQLKNNNALVEGLYFMTDFNPINFNLKD